MHNDQSRLKLSQKTEHAKETQNYSQFQQSTRNNLPSNKTAPIIPPVSLPSKTDRSSLSVLFDKSILPESLLYSSSVLDTSKLNLVSKPIKSRSASPSLKDTLVNPNKTILNSSFLNETSSNGLFFVQVIW
jgi:hypothetical protein